MKQIGKAFGILLATSVPLFLTAVYIASSVNAGRVLRWGEFSEGLLVRTSNCGGNSAAVNYCRNIALIVRVASDESGDVFDFKHLPQKYLNELSRDTYMWTTDAKYLLNAGPVRTGNDTHEVVVVCDTPYGNVPQPTIWNLHHSSIRHAAGYSNGTIGWLTPAQFAALNKSNFVELKFTPRPVQISTNSDSFE